MISTFEDAMDIFGTNSEHDRRIHNRLLSYWSMLKGNRLYPSESEIEPFSLDDVWDSCFLVEIRGEGKDAIFRFSWMGTSLIEAYGDNLLGKEVFSNLVDPHTDDICRQLQEVMRKKRPVIRDSSFKNRHGVEIKYRQCLLPLGNNDMKVTNILGGMKWKAF